MLANSPLLHTQNGFLDSRAVTGGYEVWIGMMSEGVARITVSTEPIPGDVNGDGNVDVNDLLAVIVTWGACPAPPASCPADLDHDGIVNVNDLLAVITNWG